MRSELFGVGRGRGAWAMTFEATSVSKRLSGSTRGGGGGVSPREVAEFTFPNRILFGEGSVERLGEELRALGVRRPLVATDRGVVESGTFARALGEDWAWPVYDGVEANPTEGNVAELARLYREEGCDGLIGLGGGSAIDAAKAARVMAGHPGCLEDYDYNKVGANGLKGELPPMAAIPTTAGTGSEAGRGALIQLSGSGRKMIVLSSRLLPSVAICDPELTRSLPSSLTAGTGMDALTHCVESFLSKTFHPICDGIALEGLRQIRHWLALSVRDGSHMEARRGMSLGALLGGISFHKGLGVVHSLSHALGGEGRAHHGTLNAILLPRAIRFNAGLDGGPAEESEVAPARARVAELARLVGFLRGNERDSIDHLAMMLELTLEGLPLPRRLGEVPGLDRNRIPHYAALAERDHCHRTNPRPCTRDDFERLLDACW